MRRLAARPAELQAQEPLPRRARGARLGCAASRRRRPDAHAQGAARDADRRRARSRSARWLCRGGKPQRGLAGRGSARAPLGAAGRRADRHDRARRRRRQGQQALCHPHAPGPALCRAGPRGRGGLARADAQAARRRWTGRPSKRRQVLAAGAPHARRAEGRKLSLHDALTGARRARRRRAPARRRGHPRSDRGRQRGRRARP